MHHLCNTGIKSLSLTVVLVLAATLTPMGTHAAEPKGGRAPSCQVEIPEDRYGLSNLTGFSERSNNGYAIFADQGFRGQVWVVIENAKTAQQLTHFTLLIDPLTEGYGVDVGGVSLGNFDFFAGEVPCGFPSPCTAYPDCLSCFLNRGHPYDIYDFSLQVVTHDDVEKSLFAYGRLHLDMWDYMDENGDFHRLHCMSEPEAVTIEQQEAGKWRIGSAPGGSVLSCEEYYVVAVSRAGKKGGDAQEKYEKRIAMTATTSPFVFETIWTQR